MDTSFLTLIWVEAGAHGLVSLFSFSAALLLSSSLRKNKGAKANTAWLFVSFGFIFTGVSHGSKMSAHLGLPLFENWDGVMMAMGSAFFLLGAFIWHRIVKKAIS